MNKKLQLVMWIVILLIVVVLIGMYAFNTYGVVVKGNVHPEVTIEIENYGSVKMVLYPEYAPNTVSNIIALAQSGYYDGKVVYGKDDIGLYLGRNQVGEVDDATAGVIFDDIEVGSEDDYKYSIEGEFFANRFKQNTLSIKKGTVALVRNDYTQYVQTLTKESYNSANAQLCVMMSDEASKLSGLYAGFAEITEGYEILEKLYNECELAPKEAEITDTTDEVVPEETEVVESEETAEEEVGGIEAFATYPIITKVTVDTKGEKIKEPKVVEAFDYESYISDLFSQYYGTSLE